MENKRVTYLTYFVHGTTTDNEKGIATGWAPGELSELGRKQALELRELTQGEEFAVVYCSDLQRAVDFAHLAFGGTLLHHHGLALAGMQLRRVEPR